MDCCSLVRGPGISGETTVSWEISPPSVGEFAETSGQLTMQDGQSEATVVIQVLMRLPAIRPCVCMRACSCVCACIYACICASVCARARVSVCACIKCACVCICAHMCVYVCGIEGWLWNPCLFLWVRGNALPPF